MRTPTLTGRLLDYAIALTQGFIFAKNGVNRSGDSWRRENEPIGWPIGSLCLVTPNKSKNLAAGVKNWDGWFLPEGHEAIAPNFMYDVPCFHKGHDFINIMKEEGISILKQDDETWAASYDFDSPNETDIFGKSPVSALLTCLVMKKFGKTIIIRKDLYDQIQKEASSN